MDALTRYFPVAGRLCMAAVFLYSGQDKLRHRADALAEVRALGLPAPPLIVAGTSGAQLLGGLSIVLNLFIFWGALMLAGFTAVATLAGHRAWLLKGTAARAEFTTVLEHLAIIGGLLLVAADGLRE